MRGRLEVWGGSLVLEGVLADGSSGRDFGTSSISRYILPHSVHTISSYKLTLNTEYACT